jgi:hypothetical protein
MTTNFRRYEEANSTIKSQPMHIDDLVSGQVVVQIHTPQNHYGDVIGRFQTVNYIVKKVLKTRVVLESQDAILRRHGEEPRKHEVRLIVENSKWTIRAGQVTTTIEGEANNWHRTEFKIATEGDPIIEEERKHWTKKLEEQKIKSEAKSAIEKIKNQLNPSLDSVLEAMSALGALADTLRANQR